MKTYRGETLQRGHGRFTRVPLYRVYHRQRGRGFGAFLGNAARWIAPIAKKGLLSLGKAALNAGARALEDINDNNTTVKDAFKKQAVETFHPVKAINRAMKRKNAITSPATSKIKVQRKKQGKTSRINDTPRGTL